VEAFADNKKKERKKEQPNVTKIYFKGHGTWWWSDLNDILVSG